MPSPNFTAAADIDGFSPSVVESYGAQLFLRKHLNQLHNMFYRPENGRSTSTILDQVANDITYSIPTVCSSKQGA